MSVVFESRGANIRFGAAVYGPALVVSVIGVAFGASGRNCHVRTIGFDDGSTLLMRM